jgi:hypothetical protein
VTADEEDALKSIARMRGCTVDQVRESMQRAESGGVLVPDDLAKWIVERGGGGPIAPGLVIEECMREGGAA